VGLEPLLGVSCGLVPAVDLVPEPFLLDQQFLEIADLDFFLNDPNILLLIVVGQRLKLLAVLQLQIDLFAVGVFGRDRVLYLGQLVPDLV
jgi:hypothetical protein